MSKIRTRKRGKTFSYIFEAGRKDDGKRKVVEKGGFATRELAYTAGVSAYNDWKHGNIGITSDSITVKEFIKNWLENVVALNVKPTSMQMYNSIVRKHILSTLGSLKLQELTPAILDKWIRGLLKAGYSKNTISVTHTLIHHALDYAVYPAEMIANNPANYIKVPQKAPKNIVKRQMISKKKLFEWAEFLECDMSALASHKSVDDAMATMLVFKKVCEKENKSPEQLMKDNKEFFVTTEQVALAAEERKYKKEMTAKIKEFYNRRSPNPLRHLYDGQKFELNKKVFSDLERALNIAKRIYEGGGVIYERLKGKGNIVFLDDDIESEKRTSIENKGYKIIYASEIEKIVK